MKSVTDPDWTDGFYKLAGFAMRTFGRCSDSLALRLERGFDSGEMMNRIYANRASGKYGVGTLVDRFYLNQIGCEGLRGRKVTLKQVVIETIQVQRARGMQPVIVDVASGPATYLVEAFAEASVTDVPALCRDLDENGLHRGRELACSKKVENIRYERGDAYDAASLRAIQPPPTIIIASGFYEIFFDDTMICRQMQVNRTVLAPGGNFIFTTQVNHPQLRMIAKALNNREGKPWLMKNHPVAEVEGWAREAGFRQIRSVLAPPCLYAVSVAE